MANEPVEEIVVKLHVESDAENAVNSAVKSIQKIKKAATSGNSGKAATDKIINVDGIIKASSQVDLLKMKIEGLKAKLQGIYSKDNPDLINAANTIAQIQRLQGELTALTTRTNDTRSNFARLKGTLGTVGKGFLTVGKGAAYVAGSPLLLVKKAFNGIGESLGNLLKMFKKRALYRVLNAIISGITNGFKTGIKNAYDYAVATNNQLAKSLDSISTSALYVKNSLGAMAAPIINALAPAIDFVADKFVSLLNLINEVIAKLTGADTWIRAIKYPTTYGDAADKATKANKALKKSILAIDEINPLTDNSKGSGGSGASGLDASKMFETVKTGDIKSRFSELLRPFKDAGETIKKNWGKIKDALSKVKDLLVAIGESAIVVWLNGTGQKTIETVAGIIGNIAETIGNLAESLKKAWTYNKNGQKIIQNIADSVNEVLGFIEDIWGYTSEWADNLDLEPIVSAIARITDHLPAITRFFTTVLKPIYENVILPLGKFLIERVIPFALNVIADKLDSIKIKIAILKANIDTIKTTAINAWNGLKTAAETALNSVKGKVETNITTLEKFLKLPEGTLLTKWKEAWDNIGSAISGALSSAKTTFTNFIKDVTDGLNKIINKVNEIFGTTFRTINIEWNMPSKGVSGKFEKGGAGSKFVAKAAGGMVSTGTAFVAGEAGAEVVANIGNRTGVMNVQQLSAGVEQGVMYANETQNALLREQNSLLRQILAKSGQGGSAGNTDLIAAIQNKNRRDGKTIIPVGV